jgi:hypothetical protein
MLCEKHQRAMELKEVERGKTVYTCLSCENEARKRWTSILGDEKEILERHTREIEREVRFQQEVAQYRDDALSMKELQVGIRERQDFRQREGESFVSALYRYIGRLGEEAYGAVVARNYLNGVAREREVKEFDLGEELPLAALAKRVVESFEHELELQVRDTGDYVKIAGDQETLLEKICEEAKENSPKIAWMIETFRRIRS